MNFRSKMPFFNCVLLVVISVGVLAGCGKKQDDTVKLGVILPMTGSGAVWGQNAKKGIDLALEEVNSTGGIKGNKVQLVYEDSQTEPKTAVTVFRKLIDQDRVQASIVDMISSNVLAIAPIANENKVVIISPGASAPEITDAGPYVFRNWPSDALQGMISAKFAHGDLGWKEVAILHIRNAYGEGLKETFTRSFEQMGGKVTVTESYAQGASNFRSELFKIKGAKKDGIYLLGYPAEIPLILKQARETGIKEKVLGTEPFDDPIIIKNAKEAAEGVIFSVPKPADKTTASVKQFFEKFKAKYGEDPGITADVGYDALKILVSAIERVGYSGPKIQEELLKLKDFPGAAGETTFDKNGDVIKPFIFKTIKDGQFVPFSDKVYLP